MSSQQSGPVVVHPAFGPSLPASNWVPAPRYILRRDRILRHLRNSAPCRVLDIGCGPAALLYELSHRGFEAFGVDRSDQAQILGQQFVNAAPSLTLQKELDPEWIGTMDMLFSFEVIEHIEEDEAALQSWRPYMKDDGHLILSAPAHMSKWSPNDEWAGHIRRYSRDELRDKLKRAGFEVTHMECYGFPLTSIMDPLRARAYKGQIVDDRAQQKSVMTHTEESGSNRDVESRLWRHYSRHPGQLAMQLCCQMQRPFLGTDLGNGFLVTARAA